MNEQDKITHVREHPDQHQHRTFQELEACCSIGGAVSLGLMSEHERIGQRMNGGVRCDVRSGPCACGAWH